MGLDGFEAIHFVGGENSDNKHLGPEGCEDLCLQWGDITNVTSLQIGSNSIDNVAAENLCQLLQKNDTLVYFKLYTNKIDKIAGIAFADMLAVNNTLVSLELVDCGIDDSTFKAIANELCVGNRSLMQLNLSNNMISNAGAKALGKVLKVNDIITTVSLAANSITVDGGTALVRALTLNYTLCDLFIEQNNISDFQISKIAELCDRNTTTIRDALDYCNANVKEGPLRKAKICFVGKNLSGKSCLIEALKGQGFQDHYQPTEGAKVSQVLTRLRGDMWYGVVNLPSAEFGYHFMSRFVNVKLDENIDKLEKEKTSKDIGFAGLKKKKGRRGSVQQRRASIIGQRKVANEGGLAADGRNSTARASRQSAGRRSSVAMSVLNAVMGDPTARSKRNSVKEIVKNVAHPFNRKKNDLLEDKDYKFYDDNERKPGEAKNIYGDAEVGEVFDAVVTAKARRERDNLAFNLMELSGDRIFYTVHHAFLTSNAVYVLMFNMKKLSDRADHEGRLEEIKYINYWLKVIRYHSPDAKLMVVGSHAAAVNRELYGKIESDISKLVFPELHKAHAKRKEAMKLNAAVEAANDFAKDLEDEDFVQKKTRLIVNEKDRRLFFPVEISTGKGVSNIRLALDEAAQKQKYYGQKIPVRWLKFLDALRKDSPSYFCTPKRVQALAFQTLENHEVEMQSALELFHELGYIVHVTEIDELQDTVITNTLAFYRIIFRLIFTADLAVFDMNEARKQFPDEIEEALNTGLMSEKLVDWLWEGDNRILDTINDKEGKKARQFFLEYAQLNLILSEYTFKGEKKYIVPSMIPLNPDVVTETKTKFGDGMNITAKIQFGGFLTLGVYERLLCLCLQFSSKQDKSLEPIVAMGWAQISFGLSFVFRLVREPDDIVIHVIEAKKKKKVYKLIDSFEKMLIKLRQILGQGFKWKTTLANEDGEYIEYSEARVQKIKGWFA